MARDESKQKDVPTHTAEAHSSDGERFRALAWSDFDRIAEVDAQGRTLWVSPNHGARSGPALSLADVHDEDRPEVGRAFRRALEEGESQRIAFRVRDGDATRWVECTLTPMGDEPGTRRVLVVSRDVTVVKETEARLRGSRERFRLIAENAYDMIAELDANGQVLYVNTQVARVMGTDDGHDLTSIQVHPDDLPRVKAALERTLQEGIATTATYRLAHADGRWRWIEARYRAARTETGERRVILIARDRSHDVEAERQLAASEVRYRELVEKSPLGIIVLQHERVAFANTAGAETCGAESPQALTGTPLDALLERGDVFDLERTADSERTQASEETLLEVRIRGLDGQLREVLATGNLIEFEGAPAYQALVRDITGLRRAERERKRLELQLQESRKLESLGMLAGGIAHDFNNLLAVILANARFALRHGDRDAELSEALEETIEAGERAARLTRQLLDYAGRRAPDVRSADIGALVEATTDILRSVIPNHIELSIDLDPDAPPVRADVVQIEQVLMNLVINAADAIGEARGSVRVATGATEIQTSQKLRFVEGGDLTDGCYAYLEVSDTGRGMDADTRARIFEPFFTTKAEGHGLGLAAVIGLVKGHHGAVELESTPDTGTRFRVYLPASPELETEARPNVAPEASAMLWLGELDALRDDPAWELRDATPLDARDTDQALGRLARNGDEIALVVCDARAIADPGAFLFAVETRRPGMPVLWCGPLPEADRLRGGPVESVMPGEPIAEALESLLGKP
jgi:PAS domain S-box-containing protein